MWILVGLAGLIVVGGLCSLLGIIIVARSRSTDLECPECSSIRVRPSWPKSIEGMLTAFSVRPYRCESCRHRFYGPWTSRHEPVEEPADGQPQS
jgi:hypothetical protein